MNRYLLSLTLAASLSLAGCDNEKSGRYVPVSTASGVFLVDTQTGRMFTLPPQYREGTDPKKDLPAKWKLVAEF